VTTPVIAAVGLACLDHVWQVERFPPTRSRTHASAYRSHGGGPAATAAVAAARLGAEAHLWASLGEDEAATTVERELEQEGVQLHALRASGARSFVSAVLVEPSGERHIFPYRGDALADDPERLDWSALGRAGALLTDARHPRLSEHALRAARRSGIPTVGDWSDLRHWDQTALVDHLIVSEECARAALGNEALGNEALGGKALGDADLAAALPRLRSAGHQLVAVTLGPRGILWDAGSGVRRTLAPRVDVRDSTGAGDACHGAYAVALASGRSVADAFRLASAVGALACTGPGRDALPDLAAAERLAATLPDEEQR
jgi:sulfofructose kinase